MDIAASIAAFALALSSFRAIAIVDQGDGQGESRAGICLALLFTGFALIGLSVGVLLHRRLRWTLIGFMVGVLGALAMLGLFLLIDPRP
jgi:hypothetical protein